MVTEFNQRDAQHAVTRALYVSSTEHQAIPQVLAALGSALGWGLGGYWQVSRSDQKLDCSYAWHRDPQEAARYLEISRQFRFGPGEGLPGQAWQRAAPVWVTDLLAHPDFPRVQLAAAYGLYGGVAFPVFVGPDVVGVIEFFTTDRVEVSDQDLRALEVIGSELGSFIRRVQVERELRESEHRFRSLAETANDVFVIMDERSVMQYVNPAVQRMLGYEADELIGQKLQMLIPPHLRERHEAGMARYLRTGQRHIPWSGVRLPALHKSGHEVPVEIAFSEFTANGGRAFTGVMRDVTERVRQQEALEEATAKLETTVAELRERTREAEAAARVKTHFLAAMSHELRTPLQAVIGYAGLLDAGIHGPLNEDQRASVQRVQASATHLLGLIDQVLEVARSEAGKLRLRSESIDLCELVAETAELVRPQAEEKGLLLQISPCADPGLHRVVADPGRVRQIILNLLTNAVKFTQRGSIAVEFGRQNGMARIAVRDSGVGISEDQLARVFEKFYQAEAGLTQRQPGMGLGLAISKELAASMGGEIEADSEMGRGSTFTLLLPLNGESAADPA